MTVFRGHLAGLGQWVQIDARGEDASNRTVSSASASTTTSEAKGPFKLSVPIIIGMVCVSLILIGLGVLLWRWRVRVREMARMNHSYEKYGVGRGIGSSNSYSTGGSTSKSSKADPYGSFFEVETEKPKKALLNFRRTSTLTSGATHHGSTAKNGLGGGSGWNAPSSWQRQTPAPNASPAGPAHPPGLGSRRTSGSFSFSLKKSEEKKAAPKTQHMQNSIKSKGISPPLIVANGGPEPLWSPLPSTSTFGFGTSSIPQEPQVSSSVPPKAPPPAATTTTTSSGPTSPSSSSPSPPKFKQPQPRSPPATPGTSQKADLLAVSREGRRLSVGGPTSDGSLYSRNSFSSSNHDHLVPQPPPPAATPPPLSFERDRDVLPPPPPAITSSGISGGGGISGTVKSSQHLQQQQQQRRNKPGSGNLKGHMASPSSSSVYVNQGQVQGSSPFRTGGVVPVSSSARSAGGQHYHSQSQSQSHHNQLPRLMTVIAPFTPTMEDELPLKVGDTVRIIEEYKDSWCLVQLVGRIDSPRGVVPCVCLQERKRIIPVPMNVG